MLLGGKYGLERVHSHLSLSLTTLGQVKLVSEGCISLMHVISDVKN